jgi:hypothetical protein
LKGGRPSARDGESTTQDRSKFSGKLNLRKPLSRAMLQQGLSFGSELMKTWLRMTVVLMTVGGGFAGVLITANQLFHLEGHGVAYAILVSIFFLLYAFVATSGLMFVHDPRRTRPVLVALALQIPWVSGPIFAYQFASGLFAAMTVGTPEEAGRMNLHFGLNAQIGSQFSVAGFQEIPWSLGVNLIPFLIFVLLRRSVQASSPTQQPIGANSTQSRPMSG